MALFLLVYIFMSATLAGSFMVAALSMNLDTAQPVLYSAIAGFIVAIPVADTLKRVDDAGVIEGTVDRSGLWAAQTPQALKTCRNPKDCRSATRNSIA